MNRTPHFSIMVPTYNQAHYLPACLNSLIAQSDPDWEAVVVDDGSTDDTPRILEAFSFKDPRIRAIRQENGGTAVALNTALKNCQGQWICWLSSDDLFEPDKLAIHRKAVAEHAHIRFFHTHFYHLEDSSGMKTAPEHWRPIPDPGLQVARFLSGNYVSGITICVDRQAMLEVGQFRTDLRHGQDFAFWLTLSRQVRSHFIDRRTVITRWHDGQTTNSFPVAGLYDSAWACLEMLNTSPFPAVFPALDLCDPGQAHAAVTETLAICLDGGSFIYQLGYSPALMHRLLEWLNAPEAGEARALGRNLLEQTAHRDVLANKPKQIQDLFALAARHRKPFVFIPEPIETFIRRTIADHATDECKRHNLIRYLGGKKQNAEKMINEK